MDTAAVDPAQFVHVRMVLSMVVGLAIARLLTGFARFVQHPGRHELYAVHLLWAAYMLVLLIHFWWWEFALSRVSPWHFGAFAFVVGYSALLYLLCTLLFPDDIAEYAGFRDYFMSRRRWFFGLLALMLLLDVADTWIKGTPHLLAQGPAYALRTALGVGLCGAACVVENQRFHLAFAGLGLAHEAWWIVHRYDVLG